MAQFDPISRSAVTTPPATTATDPSRASVAPGASPAEAYARSARSLKILFPVVLLLLATHLGEFWPFSIYPMFSRAGRPFTRSVVRELSSEEAYRPGTYAEADLPGKPFGVIPAGISQNDVANFVSKTEQWTPERAQGLHHLFAEHLTSHRLLVFAASGRLIEGGVSVQYRPIVELTAEGPLVVPPERERTAIAEQRP